MARAITAKEPMSEKGKRQKRIDIQEGANGFILNKHEYEYEYGGKPQVFRNAEEVAEAVKKFLGE